MGRTYRNNTESDINRKRELELRKRERREQKRAEKQQRRKGPQALYGNEGFDFQAYN
jgi:hypothetical protein